MSDSLRVAPKYCEYCGRELVEKITLAKYDRSSGNRVFNYFMRCPKYIEHWSQLHDKILVDTK